MSTNKQIVLINPTAEAILPELAGALRERGAEVKEMQLGDFNAVLDLLEQGWMPVVLKKPPV